MHLSQGATAAAEDCGESEVWRARLERTEAERMADAEDRSDIYGTILTVFVFMLLMTSGLRLAAVVEELLC